MLSKGFQETESVFSLRFLYLGIFYELLRQKNTDVRDFTSFLISS